MIVRTHTRVKSANINIVGITNKCSRTRIYEMVNIDFGGLNHFFSFFRERLVYYALLLILGSSKGGNMN